MNFLTWGRSPWQEQILTHVSWDLLWASFFAGNRSPAICSRMNWS